MEEVSPEAPGLREGKGTDQLATAGQKAEVLPRGLRILAGHALACWGTWRATGHYAVSPWHGTVPHGKSLRISFAC